MSTNHPSASESGELLPCPFCGSAWPAMHPNDLATCGRELSNPHIDTNYGHCDGCGADGPVEMTESAAREAWNRRAAQPVAAPTAGDALKVALDALDRSEPMYSRQFSQQERKAQHISAMDTVRAALANQPAPTVPAGDDLKKALQTIARWHGEFPETGKTWDDGSPMSYAACYGSNGERDYMRQIALDALAHQPAQEQAEPESGSLTNEGTIATPQAPVAAAPDAPANDQPTTVCADNCFYGDCPPCVKAGLRATSTAQQAHAGADEARIDHMEQWLKDSAARGFMWNSYDLMTDKPVREQIDANMKSGLYGRRAAIQAAAQGGA